MYDEFGDGVPDFDEVSVVSWGGGGLVSAGEPAAPMARVAVRKKPNWSRNQPKESQTSVELGLDVVRHCE